VTHDRRSAARAGLGPGASTGHALAPGGSPDGPQPTNLVLAGGGAADEGELVAGVERGLYVTRLWYVNPVHSQQTLVTGVTREGTFLIEDGQLVGPLRDLRFTDSVLRLLSDTDELAASQSLVSAGEFYGRRFATGVACPAVRAHGFRITGAASRP
jgi:predicted Zn-dependent protease